MITSMNVLIAVDRHLEVEVISRVSDLLHRVHGISPVITCCKHPNVSTVLFEIHPPILIICNEAHMRAVCALEDADDLHAICLGQPRSPGDVCAQRTYAPLEAIDVPISTAVRMMENSA